MNLIFFNFLATCLCQSFVLKNFEPELPPSTSNLLRRDACENSPTSRSCWGEYSIDTDYYAETPHTGVTREYWLTAENITLSLDGYERQVLAYNGSIPGPTLFADWGDNLAIHVTNNMKYNGTSVHWHGVRQLGNNEYDGVPGVTQCPIPPGQSFTYKFQATQYGSTWYHSHFSLQYTDGLYGALLINGPATADYDEDLGMMFLSDWPHEPISEIWESTRQKGAPSLQNGLINGTNTYDCSHSSDLKCIGNGKKFETVFDAGKKYRIGLTNVATNGHFQFSIDGHSLTVISNDLVPIVPYQTDSILINMGQRYEVIVEANAEPGDYWLRGGWQMACSANDNPENITGIVRYDATSTDNPTTTGITVGDSCGDEPLASLVPHLALDVTSLDTFVEEEVGIAIHDYLVWTINSSSLYLNWSEPTNLRVWDHDKVFPVDYNALSVETSGSDDEWEIVVLEDKSGLPQTHPIHLHGHDLWVLSQDTKPFDCANASLNVKNPPRRDTVSLPSGGHVAIAFRKDNPGAWLMHCHVAWHASQGFALQMVESQDTMRAQINDTWNLGRLCYTWDEYQSNMVYAQYDSGI